MGFVCSEAGVYLPLHEQKRLMVEYLCMKVTLHDWHAVSDAANDLRELEARIQCQAQKLT